MQVTLQALFSSPDGGNTVVVDTNSQATVQTLISDFCSKKGIAYSSRYGIFDGAKRPLPLYSTLQSVGVTGGENLFIGYRNNTYQLQTRWALYVAILALVIGVVGIVTMSLVYGLSGGVIPFDFGVVMDAGSSKTNSILYRWKGDKYNGTGCVEQKDACKVKPGIADSGTEQGIQNIIDCTRKVIKPIENKLLPTTPLYFAATAGMRLLNLANPEKAEEILTALSDNLTRTGMSVRDVGIISGRNEGIYAWTTTNFLKNNLDKDPTEPWTPVTVGALDMGGASTQIAFSLPPTDDNINNDYVSKMELYGQTHYVFSRSYLCFGRAEALKRFQALLVTDPKKTIIEDPCVPEGFDRNATGKFIFTEPCTESDEFEKWIKNDKTILEKEYIIVGKSNYAQCAKKISELTDTALCKKKNFKACFEKLPRQLEDQQFTAFATFLFTTQYLNVTNSTLDEYERVTKDFCGKTYKEIVGDTNDEYAAEYCFNAVLIHQVLVEGYGFNTTTWKNLEFIGEVDKTELGWTLGYMINSTNAVPAKKPSKRLISPVVLTICLLIFIIAVIATIIYTFHTLSRKNKDSSNGSAQSLYQSP